MESDGRAMLAVGTDRTVAAPFPLLLLVDKGNMVFPLPEDHPAPTIPAPFTGDHTPLTEIIPTANACPVIQKLCVVPELLSGQWIQTHQAALDITSETLNKTDFVSMDPLRGDFLLKPPGRPPSNNLRIARPVGVRDTQLPLAWWCNGNTAAFGAVIHGSNPCRAANLSSFVKIIAVSNQKGGVGKTTTSVNLGAGLAARGERILLADIDPQGNASSALGFSDSGFASLYQTLIGESPVEELIRASRLPSLSVIPANLDMAGAEIEVARMDGHLLQLRNALAGIRQSDQFDYMILDCPPSLGIWMSNALAAADEILIPIQCEYYSLEGLSLLLQVTDEIRASGANPELAISGLLMTMYDGRTSLNPAVVREVRNHFGEVVFDTVIPRTVRFGEAPSHGRTIFEHDPGGAGAAAYADLAKEFLKRQKKGLSFVPPPREEPATT